LERKAVKEQNYLNSLERAGIPVKKRNPSNKRVRPKSARCFFAGDAEVGTHKGGAEVVFPHNGTKPWEGVSKKAMGKLGGNFIMRGAGLIGVGGKKGGKKRKKKGHRLQLRLKLKEGEENKGVVGFNLCKKGPGGANLGGWGKLWGEKGCRWTGCF